MKAAAQVADLQVLERLLQERLHSEMPQGDFLEVQCAIKNGTLMVLSQHPAEVVPEPKSMLEGLQRAIQSLQLQFAQLVQLDLRVVGQKRPYATHSFTLQRPVSLPIEKPAGLEKTCTPASVVEEYENPNSSDETPAAEVTNLVGSSETYSDSFEPLAPAPDLPSPIVPSRRDRQFQLPLPILLAAGACAGLAASIKGVNLLTSACVIGECEQIQTAQQLSQESTVAAVRAKSQQQLTVAQQQLLQATETLETIPRWSPHYQEAEDLSQTLSTPSVTLNQAVTALQKASVAAQKSQNPPHTVQQWQEIEALLQEAITLLEAVPSDSVLAPLAEQKLPGYRATLKSVNQQLDAEQQASNKLTQALEKATVATKYQDAARSLQDWQQAQSTWHLAVNELASIPKTSTAYKEAQQLLGTYRHKLAAVRDRTTKEQISAKAYNQAVSLATLATRYEQQNQLTSAVTNWTEALNEAKQVSDQTFYYGKAQSLIDSYSSALKQAEDKLSIANILQKTRADLNRTCSGNPRICNYSLKSVGITVRLTSDYEQAVKRILKTATASGDLKTQARVAEHYKTLQQALEAISYNANLPLEVYDAKGAPIHTYKAGT